MSIGLSLVKRRDFRLCLDKHVNKSLYYFLDSSEDETTVIKKEKKQNDHNPMIQSVSIFYTKCHKINI